MFDYHAIKRGDGLLDRLLDRICPGAAVTQEVRTEFQSQGSSEERPPRQSARVAAIVTDSIMKDSNDEANEWPPEVVAKVEHNRAARKAVQQQFGELFAKVAEAMFRQDPIGINFETNSDEYDPEAGTVIPRLKHCSSPKDVTTVLHEEFSAWFGSDTAGPRDRYAKLGEEIWLLWRVNQTERDTEGSR